jgi:hypothetical protein
MALRRALLVIVVALGGTACTTVAPSSPAVPTASHPVITATPTSVPTPSPRPTPLIPAPATGRPYAADQVLAAMRDSRRPGGVPDQLETAEVAAGLAAAIWTYDGGPYPALVIGGSCGPSRCTVEVSGTPPGAAGTDLYAFAVTPGSGAVEFQAADLHGYPAGLDALLDQVARDRASPCAVEGLALSSATWRIPPDAGTFWAHYRFGGEEGSPGVDVLIDLPAGSVVRCAAP